MAQVIELPNGSFYQNGVSFEDQSAAAKTWVQDNFPVWIQTYMYLGAIWVSNMVSLPSGYTGSWDNRKEKTSQTQDGEPWYDDASPVFKTIVIWNKASNSVDLIRGDGVYNNNLPLASQTAEVVASASQLLDQARRLAILIGTIPEDVLLPNAAIWDNNLPYSAQSASAQTEADLLWSGGLDTGQALIIDGASFINQKDNATWRLVIPTNASQDYNIQII